MGLFDTLKKYINTKDAQAGGIEILAPISGELIRLEEVPDVVFAEKIVGDGVAIRPNSDTLVAPCDGVIGKIFETNHAFSIRSRSGLELFVHFGIDTVELRGEGFRRLVEEGDEVQAGQAIIKLDLPLLQEKAKSTITPVIISNMDDVRHINKSTGSVSEGNSVIMSVGI